MTKSASIPTMTLKNNSGNNKKSVKFAPKVKVILSLALEDFTDDEIDSIWITPEEHNTSKQHLSHTLKVLQSNGGAIPLDLHSDFTALGLDHVTSQARRENKERHLNTVLDVQDDSSACPETIARISEAMSQSSIRHAAVAANDLATDLSN